jgi:hypothetical protein
MKNVKKSGLSVMVLSVFVLSPAVSSAQLSTDVTGSVTGTVESAVDANVDANTNLDTAVGTGSDATSETNVNTGMGADVDNDTDAQSESTSNATLKVNARGVAVVTSSQVNSEEDLEVFISNVAATEKAVSKVKIDSDNNGSSQTKVVYRHKGKLFGFIPMTVKSTTVVETKTGGEVRVVFDKPWYAFLVVGENYAKADLESRIKNNPTIRANANANASASAKAEVVESIIAEVTANADANAQASVNG